MNAFSDNTLNFIDLGEQSYRPVWDFQRHLQRLRIGQKIDDTLLFVEHRPVYTIGKNGTDLHVVGSKEFLKRRGIEVVQVDRGGDVTYHGPGQLVGYPIFDLHRHKKSISWFMRSLEEVFIDALANWQIDGTRQEDYTGVWVGEEKLVAMGVRISRWVTMHGFAMNVNTDLSDFDGIIPCGIFHRGVTSLAQLLGRRIEMQEVKSAVLASFVKIFQFSGVRIEPSDFQLAVAVGE